MKPLRRSRARYTRPNLPLPSGRPISNMPRWNCLNTCCSCKLFDLRSCLFVSSEAQDPEPVFRGGSSGPLGLDARHWACEGTVTCVTVLVVF